MNASFRMEGRTLRVVLQNKAHCLLTPAACTLGNEPSCFSPPGSAAGNSRVGGDGKQVLPCSAHSTSQILALQQEGDGPGSAPAGSGWGDNRPSTKVSDGIIQRVLLWEIFHGDNLLQGRHSPKPIGREQILQISNGIWWHDLEIVGLILQGFSQIFLFTLYWVLHTFRTQVGDFLMHVMKSVSYRSLKRCFSKLQNSFLSFL